jgi:hypothetical protein
MLHHVGWIGLAAVAVTVSVWREDTAGAVTVVSFPSYCSLLWLQPFFSSFLLAIAAAYTAVVDGDIASSVRDCLLLLLLCGECVAWGVATALSVALIFFAFCAGSVWHGVCPLLSLSH